MADVVAMMDLEEFVLSASTIDMDDLAGIVDDNDNTNANDKPFLLTSRTTTNTNPSAHQNQSQNNQSSSSHRSVDEDQVEELLSAKLMNGFMLLEQPCPNCMIPLVKKPRPSHRNSTLLKSSNSTAGNNSNNLLFMTKCDDSSLESIPIEAGNANGIKNEDANNDDDDDDEVSCYETARIVSALTLEGVFQKCKLPNNCSSSSSKRRPIKGLPFCVTCESYVVTNPSESRLLDQLKTIDFGNPSNTHDNDNDNGSNDSPATLDDLLLVVPTMSTTGAVNSNPSLLLQKNSSIAIANAKTNTTTTTTTTTTSSSSCLEQIQTATSSLFFQSAKQYYKQQQLSHSPEETTTTIITGKKSLSKLAGKTLVQLEEASNSNGDDEQGIELNMQFGSQDFAGILSLDEDQDQDDIDEARDDDDDDNEDIDDDDEDDVPSSSSDIISALWKFVDEAPDPAQEDADEEENRDAAVVDADETFDFEFNGEPNLGILSHESVPCLEGTNNIVADLDNLDDEVTVDDSGTTEVEYSVKEITILSSPSSPKQQEQEEDEGEEVQPISSLSDETEAEIDAILVKHAAVRAQEDAEIDAIFLEHAAARAAAAAAATQEVEEADTDEKATLEGDPTMKDFEAYGTSSNKSMEEEIMGGKKKKDDLKKSNTGDTDEMITLDSDTNRSRNSMMELGKKKDDIKKSNTADTDEMATLEGNQTIEDLDDANRNSKSMDVDDDDEEDERINTTTVEAEFLNSNASYDSALEIQLALDKIEQETMSILEDLKIQKSDDKSQLPNYDGDNSSEDEEATSTSGNDGSNTTASNDSGIAATSKKSFVLIDEDTSLSGASSSASSRQTSTSEGDDNRYTSSEYSVHSSGSNNDTNNKSVEHNDDIVQEYTARREIATKVLGAKMLQGYSLRDCQCEQCGMPKMEYQSIVLCVVCPVLARKAKKELRKRQHKKEKKDSTAPISENDILVVEDASEEDDLVDGVLQKIEDASVASSQGLDNQTQSSASKLEESTAAVVAAKEAKLKKAQREEEIAARKQKEKAEEQAALKRNEAAMAIKAAKAAKKQKETAKAAAKKRQAAEQQEATSKSIPNTIEASDKEASLCVAAKAPKCIKSAEARRKELSKKESVLLEEADVAKEEAKASHENEKLMPREQRHEQRAQRKEATKKAEELRNDELKLIHEAKRLEIMERMRLANEIEFKSPQESSLAVLALQEERKRLRREARRQQERRLKEEARIEGERQIRIAADERRTAKETSMLEALENEAQRKSREAEDAIAKANAAMEEVKTAKKDIIAQVIAQGEADTVAETEALLGAEAEDFHQEQILPTHSCVLRERWEILRLEGRSVMTRRLIAGWAMLPRYCVGNNCQNSPLLAKGGKTECVVCGGDGNGEDGLYLASTSSEEDEDQDVPNVMPSFSNRAVVTNDPSHPQLEVAKSAKEIHEDFEEKRQRVSKEIGKRMLQGWTLLDMSCPNCVMPLLTDDDGDNEICVLCGIVGQLAPESTSPSETADEAVFQRQPDVECDPVVNQGLRDLKNVASNAAAQVNAQFNVVSRGAKEYMNDMEKKCGPDNMDRVHDLQEGCIETNEHLKDIALQSQEMMIEQQGIAGAFLLEKPAVKNIIAMMSDGACSPRALDALELQEACHYAQETTYHQLPAKREAQVVPTTNSFESILTGLSELGVPSNLHDDQAPATVAETTTEAKFTTTEVNETVASFEELANKLKSDSNPEATTTESHTEATTTESHAGPACIEANSIEIPDVVSADSMVPVSDESIKGGASQCASPKSKGFKRGAAAAALEIIKSKREGKARDVFKKEAPEVEKKADASNRPSSSRSSRSNIKRLSIDVSVANNDNRPSPESPRTTPKTPVSVRSGLRSSSPIPSPRYAQASSLSPRAAGSPSNYQDLSSRLRNMLAGSASPNNHRVARSAPSSPMRTGRSSSNYLINSIAGKLQRTPSHDDPPAMASYMVIGGRRVARDPEDDAPADEAYSHRRTPSSLRLASPRSRPFPGMSPSPRSRAPRPFDFPDSPRGNAKIAKQDAEGVTLVIPKDFDVSDGSQLRELIMAATKQQQQQQKRPGREPSPMNLSYRAPSPVHLALKGRITQQGNNEVINVIDLELPENYSGSQATPRLQVDTRGSHDWGTHHGIASPGEQEVNRTHLMQSPNKGSSRDAFLSSMHPPSPGEDGVGAKPRARKSRPKITPETMTNRTRPRTRPSAESPHRLRSNSQSSTRSHGSNYGNAIGVDSRTSPRNSDKCSGSARTGRTSPINSSGISLNTDKVKPEHFFHSGSSSAAGSRAHTFGNLNMSSSSSVTSSRHGQYSSNKAASESDDIMVTASSKESSGLPPISPRKGSRRRGSFASGESVSSSFSAYKQNDEADAVASLEPNYDSLEPNYEAVDPVASLEPNYKADPVASLEQNYGANAATFLEHTHVASHSSSSVMDRSTGSNKSSESKSIVLLNSGSSGGIEIAPHHASSLQIAIAKSSVGLTYSKSSGVDAPQSNRCDQSVGSYKSSESKDIVVLNSGSSGGIEMAPHHGTTASLRVAIAKSSSGLSYGGSYGVDAPSSSASREDQPSTIDNPISVEVDEDNASTTSSTSGVSAPPSISYDAAQPSTVDNPISVDVEEDNASVTSSATGVTAPNTAPIAATASDIFSVKSSNTTTFDGIIRRMDVYKNKLAASQSGPAADGEDVKLVNLIEKLTTAAAGVDTINGSHTDDDASNK